MRTRVRSLITISLFTMATVAISGCLTVRAPESVNIGSGNRVDSGEPIPATRDHEEARNELRKAYSEIRGLRRKVADLKEDKRELKEELREAEEDHDDDDDD